MRKYRFRNWLRNWLNTSDQEVNLAPQPLVESVEKIQSDGMRFQLYKANGGYVIETSRVDRVKDRVYHQMYVVPNEADIGQELGKIITMEALRG